jgi:hypothetical protein
MPEALFIAGGDQWNYGRVCGASPVEAAVQEPIDRGVPVGGQVPVSPCSGTSRSPRRRIR